MKEKLTGIIAFVGLLILLFGRLYEWYLYKGDMLNDPAKPLGLLIFLITVLCALLYIMLTKFGAGKNDKLSKIERENRMIKSKLENRELKKQLEDKEI